MQPLHKRHQPLQLQQQLQQEPPKIDMKIDMVLFDFDDTIVRGKMGIQGRARQLDPLSHNKELRNAKITKDVFDPAAFVSFVNTLVANGVAVGITSFGNAPPIRWYLESLFNPHAPSLHNITHPFQNSVVAKGDPIYGKLISQALASKTGPASSDKGYGKVILADLIRGDIAPEHVLVFDDDPSNVEALRRNHFNAVQIDPQTGFTDEVVHNVARHLGDRLSPRTPRQSVEFF